MIDNQFIANQFIALPKKFCQHLYSKVVIESPYERHDFFVREIDCVIFTVKTTYPSHLMRNGGIKTESKMFLYKGCPVLFKGLQLIYVADIPFSKLMWKRKKVIV